MEKFRDCLRKLASSWWWFWFQSVLEGYFDFFHQKPPLPLGVLKTVLTSEIKFYGFFTGTFQFSRKEFSKNFTYTHIYFHACDFKDIFTQTFRFSRALFKIFSRRPEHFHGQKPKNFHAEKNNFHGEKKKHWWKNQNKDNVHCINYQWYLPKAELNTKYLTRFG